MSWVRDGLSSYTKAFGDVYHAVTSLGGNYENDVSRFFENELSKKSDLRGAQVESVLSGVPYLGEFLRGVEGVQQYEDLYNNTGKIPQYPANQNLGAGSLGHVASGITRKIEDGSNDLAEYYSGDRAINAVFDQINHSNPNALGAGKVHETGWIPLI